MAKTIKELAKKFVYENCENDSQCFLTEYAYTSGANAVLEKIESHLNRVDMDNHSDDDLEDLYDTLCEMVKNLKGE